MKINQALEWSLKQLRSKKISSAQLDAEVLLAHVLGRDRAFLFAHSDEPIQKEKNNRFKKMIQRRKKHEPVAHIIAEKYFYNLNFKINNKVLIPRPESERLVDLGLDYLKKNRRKKITVIDVGTGSGAIITSLAKNFKKAKYFGTDNYSRVLAIAKKNAKLNRARVEFIKSDLLKKLGPAFWKKNQHILLIANLPYLPTRVWRESMLDVKKYEPREALDGGNDGLNYYRRLILELENILPEVKSFQTYWEIDPSQPDKLKKLLKELGAKKIKTYKDLCGRTRIIGWKK